MANEVRITSTWVDKTGPGSAATVRNVAKVEQATEQASKSTASLAERGFAKAQAAGAGFGEMAAKGGAALAVFGGAAMAATAVLDKGITVALTEANAQVALGEQGFAQLSEAADANANVMGFTRSEFLATAGSAASLAKNLGFSEIAAAKLGAAFPDLADKLAVLANGKVTTAEAADQLRSAMAGEFDPLQAMGIAINAASVETRALALQQQSSTRISKEQATAMAVLAIVQEQTADASKTMATEAGKAASKAQQSSAELRQSWEELQRSAVPVLSQITQGLAGATKGFSAQAGAVRDALSGQRDWNEANKVGLKEFFWPDSMSRAWGKLTGATEDGSDATKAAALNVGELAEGASVAAQSEEELAEATREAISAIEDQINVTLGGRDAARGWQEAIDDAAASLHENGRTLDITTEKGRANSKALDDIAKAALEQAQAVRDAGGSEADFRGQLERSRAVLIEQAKKFGMTSGQAQAYARRILGIPRKWDTKVSLDAAGAIQRARDVRIAIANIRGKTVTVSIRETRYRSAVDIGQARGEKRTAGVVGAYATAAAAGVHSGMTLVGEEGPELAYLPPGTMMQTAGATKRMLAEQPAGGGLLVLNIDIGGRRLGQLLVDPLRREVRTLGGDVQAALGSGRGRTVAT